MQGKKLKKVKVDANPVIRKTGSLSAPNIRQLMRSKKKAGDIGIEVEVEGNKFPKEGYYEEKIPKMWQYHKDGSLRGNDNAEYVLRLPIAFNEVPAAVDALWDMFKSFGSILDESNRTSVHVHLNAQEFDLKRLCTFCALYLSVEEILTQWCGDHRVGNLFCLRAKDAPSIVSVLKKFFQEEDVSVLFDDNLHYAGLNIEALRKFGSVEIRALRGVTDKNILIDWVNILENIYKLSGEFNDPREVCEGFSGGGALDYFERVIGPNHSKVRTSLGWDYQELMVSLLSGIRIAQDLCYCRDWSKYQVEQVVEDPFGREVSEGQLAQAAGTSLGQMMYNQLATLSTHTLVDYIVSPPLAHTVTVPFSDPFSPALENSTDIEIPDYEEDF